MSVTSAFALGVIEPPPMTKKIRLPVSYINPRRACFDDLVSDCSVALGKSLSTADRAAKGLHAPAYNYGEISITTMAALLAKIRYIYSGPSRGAFWDLGAGTGKGVFAAALCQDFDVCGGVEVLDSLHEASIDLLRKWGSHEFRETLPEDSRPGDIRFLHGDIIRLKSEWTRGDIIFANSTCFDEVFLTAIAEAAEACRVGTFFITLTKRLPSHKWAVLDAELMVMSWGGATVFIQRKILP